MFAVIKTGGKQYRVARDDVIVVEKLSGEPGTTLEFQDVLMIGEIRDSETARIAMRAALSGHLVLLTLHAAVAAEGVAAMINFGVEPFLLATSLIGVVAQQLVWTICPDCRCDIPVEVSPDDLDPVFREEFCELVASGKAAGFSFGQGCDRCFGSGYRSRTGLFEVLRVTPAIRNLAINKVPAADIEDAAVAEGMVRLRTQGVRMVIEGRTTIEEVLRVVQVPDTEETETAEAQLV